MINKNELSSKFFLTNIAEAIYFVWLQSRSQKLPLAIFFALCLNLLIAPIVYAANGTLERFSAWAIGVLGLITIGIIIYLFIVVFEPERF